MKQKLKNPSDMSKSSAAKTQLKGVNRAVQILEYVAVHKGRAIDISEALGISWATLFRTLKQLEQNEFLIKDPDTNQYSVGRRMWFIGSTYVADHHALEIARPYLEQLAKANEATIQYVERSGPQSSTLLSLSQGKPITKATFGYHFPLHAGSKGLVLLAHAPEEFIEDYLSKPLHKLTSETEVDSVKIYKRLLEIRKLGYSKTVADIQPFTASVAAPIKNARNETIASIAMVVRKSALQGDENQTKAIEAILDTSQSISMSLGWRP